MNTPPVAKKTWKVFWSIIAMSVVALVMNLPSEFSLFGRSFYRPNFAINIAGNTYSKDLDLKYGLDLAGGSALVYKVNSENVSSGDLPSALESLKGNIERRVNLFGISEANVQLSTVGEQHRLTIELPGVTDINQAIDLIGKTAQLSFKGIIDVAPEATSTATIDDVLKDTGLNGSHLIRSMPQPNPNTGQIEVSLEFDAEGAKLFEKATKDYLNKRIAIVLDGEVITAPTVQSVIPDGKAVINGNFDTQSAKSLTAQLNAGALPLSIELIQQTTVGATLGKDSVEKGFYAGMVGLLLVAIFMIGNYGYLGFISCLALIIYGLITLTLYRLIPVTLTFPGLVGFILSIGMAVDSNILIFERFREELRDGKPWSIAMELAFGKAWDSIKDANTSTIITGLILFNPFNWSFLNTSGMVRGFAVTLILGIFISIFTGVFVTRNLLRVLARKN